MGLDTGKLARRLIVVTLLAFLVWVHFRAFQSTRGMDFEHYYVGSKMVAAGEGAHLHDLNSQFEWQRKLLGGESTPFNYPAPMTLLYWPTTLLDLNGAYLLWSVMSMLMFASSILLLNKTFRLVQDSWFLLLVCAAYLPVHATLATGQCDAFLLLAYSISLVLLAQGKAGTSGLVLSLALLKFHLVLPFGVVMLFRKQWRFLLGFAAGGLAMLAVWIGISGTGIFGAYPRLVMGIKDLPRGRFEPSLMANFRGMFSSLAGHEAPFWLIAAVAVAGLYFVARRWRTLETGFAASIAMMILTSYHSYVYDLILLLIPLLVAIKAMGQSRIAKFAIVGLLWIPVVPYLLARHREVWILIVPIAMLCWLLVSDKAVLANADERSTETAQEISAARSQ